MNPRELEDRYQKLLGRCSEGGLGVLSGRPRSKVTVKQNLLSDG